MTLTEIAEAMRLGAQMGPQAFGVLFNNSGGACAVGAAIAGCGMTQRNNPRPFGEYFGVRPDVVVCPACGEHSALFNVIVCLNDVHRWTREDIADWLEAQEQPSVAIELPVEEEAWTRRR